MAQGDSFVIEPWNEDDYEEDADEICGGCGYYNCICDEDDDL